MLNHLTVPVAMLYILNCILVTDVIDETPIQKCDSISEYQFRRCQIFSH
ncbi:hypothetical protein VAE122_2970048 [Vibrio aestuarianus]|nr:hypothetical protein VAEU17_240105 [Vibrio aestuarianus]CAH8200338.1 hypothetical protein VAE128_460694 [Vibrio aestuarianus]CAH8214325.1 hypothetical protein VAE122_2970048 [Vibrio aestuarianus]